ncbi:hypothetical protein F4553_001910 [Allocatelliglobosispora scoriae]|uniref:Uncharacterized protein n=1 Tax=Allocatelliglobosispora scoriae TaxID=643052 RepID=A0A841BNX8_9ACTN|nr:hypothetical protein [Allocatelliglobosispora scoriae]MBB5868531.1 hypothetical protein [Allocatelliglobosispora scoriae]
MEAFDRYGELIISGPYVPDLLARCVACHQNVEFDPRRGTYLTAWRQRCTPEARRPRCVWEGVQQFGLNPRYYPGHHLMCQCQTTISRDVRGSRPYPFPQRVPWHCRQPAQLARDRWLC